MNAVALELPENVAEWASWFERQIVGPDLRLLVRQLELLADSENGPFPPSLANDESWASRLDTVLGNRMPQILQHGLGQVSTEELRSLMAQPRLFLALQELIFLEGSDYWQTVPRSDEHRKLANEIRTQVLEKITSVGQTNDDPNVNSVDASPVEPRQQTNDLPRKSFLSRRHLLYVAALAASVLIAVLLVRSSDQGQFFARSGLLTSSASGDQFLLSLSTAVREDWRPELPDDQFREQLQRLRDSCDRLIDADLRQIDPQVAAALRERCIIWRTNLTNLLDDIDGGRPVNDVRAEANTMVERLTNVIQGLG